METNSEQTKQEQRIEAAEDDVIGFHCNGGCPQPPPAPQPPPGNGPVAPGTGGGGPGDLRLPGIFGGLLGLP